MKYYIGLDVGGSKIGATAFAQDGTFLAETTRTTPKIRDSFVSEVDSVYTRFVTGCADMVSTLEAEIGQTCTVGLGIPGALNQRDGTVLSENLPFLEGRSLRDDLQKAMARPIRMANDANCMALAEAVDGAGEGFSTVFGLILGTGVGGGLVWNHHVFDGLNGFASEVGHMPFPFLEEGEGSDAPCVCRQKNCVEKVIGGPALERMYKKKTGKTVSGRDIAEYARTGNTEALQILDHYYELVAKAMSLILHAYDPEVITVGGGLNSLPGLYTEVPKRWGRYCLCKEPRTSFVPAIHGSMSGVRGAAWLWRDGADDLIVAAKDNVTELKVVPSHS